MIVGLEIDVVSGMGIAACNIATTVAYIFVIAWRAGLALAQLRELRKPALLKEWETGVGTLTVCPIQRPLRGDVNHALNRETYGTLLELFATHRNVEARPGSHSLPRSRV